MVCPIELSEPFALYIHVPFCLSKCDYCDFFSKPCSIIPDEYITAVCNEIEFRLKKLKLLNPFLKVSTIYIGGGTPSLLNNSQFNKLKKQLDSFISLSELLEFTVELNPDDISENLLMLLDNSGVTRISCGIQSLNDESLHFVNRRADKKKIMSALELLKNNWNHELSLDMIAGLPFETEESFVDGLQTVMDEKPDHISLYTLTVEEGTKLFTKIENGLIDYDFDFSDKLWMKGYKLLNQNGYLQYEVSNFSKKGFECRHNMFYWHHGNYLGFGCGATGTIYNKNLGYRWTNKTDLQKYMDFWNMKSFNVNKTFFNIEDFYKSKNTSDLIKTDNNEVQNLEIISGNEAVFEFFMMGLRTSTGVNSSDYKKIFNEDLSDKFCSLMRKWKSDGLAEIKKQENNTNYSLNKKGILFLNRFLEELL